MNRKKFKLFALFFLIVSIFTLTSCKVEGELLEKLKPAKQPDGVPQEVIDLVNAGGEYPEPQEWALKVETVSQRSYTEQTNEDPRITKSSSGTVKSGLDCFKFNIEWHCETKRYSASWNLDSYLMLNPLVSVVWPGNLVQGVSLISGVPTSIPVAKRQPGTIISMISNSGAVKTRTVEMTFSTVNQAMNDILTEYGGQGYAKYHFSMELIENASDLNYKLKEGFNGADISTAFGGNFTENKTRMLVKLKLDNFTVGYEKPADLNGIFTPDITVDDLKYYTGNGNPICFISSVTYGVIYLALYETDATKEEMQDALRFSYMGITNTTPAEALNNFTKTMSKTTVRIFQIGGGATGGITAGMALNYDAIIEFLEKGASFNAQNPGAPISYTVKYLKSGKPVRMNNCMEYEKEECVPTVTENECPE